MAGGRGTGSRALTFPRTWAGALVHARENVEESRTHDIDFPKCVKTVENSKSRDLPAPGCSGRHARRSRLKRRGAVCLFLLAKSTEAAQTRSVNSPIQPSKRLGFLAKGCGRRGAQSVG